MPLATLKEEDVLESRNYVYFTVYGRNNDEYDVIYRKADGAWTCTCIHGSWYGQTAKNKEGGVVCRHVRMAQDTAKRLGFVR